MLVLDAGAGCRCWKRGAGSLEAGELDADKDRVEEWQHSLSGSHHVLAIVRCAPWPPTSSVERISGQHEP